MLWLKLQLRIREVQANTCIIIFGSYIIGVVDLNSTGSTDVRPRFLCLIALSRRRPCNGLTPP
jgi:hypothetical protein